MKIAYINVVYGEKSTGRTLADLKKAHEERGDICKVFYGVGDKSNQNNVHKITSKFSYYVHNVMSRLVGLEGYFSYFSTLKLVKKLKQFDPDIISLHNLHGHYLNLPVLFKYLKDFKKPVFLTTHDCWMLTGKCTAFTAIGCAKYATECSNCPAKKHYPNSLVFDFSKKMYSDKKKWLSNIKNLQVICVSEWMKGQVKTSFLKDKNITVVRNWVDSNVFNWATNQAKCDTRETLGIKQDEFVVVAVSAHWKAGSPRYEDLQKLIYKLKDNQRLVVVGLVQDEFKGANNVTFASFISDTKYLANIYGIADVFVHFSVEDTFGKVIAEAQNCGVPAIVYDSTACPEVARLGNGYVVEPRNVQKAYKIICDIQALPKDRRDILKQERNNKSTKIFDKEESIKKRFNVYDNALSFYN